MSFLFIWQLTFSAPLSIASGTIGLAQYATYIFPALGNAKKVTLPVLGVVEINAIPVVLVAIGALGVASFSLVPAHYTNRAAVKVLMGRVMLTILWSG
jgi:hypothetical protein